jgi:hypothetical protein
LNRKANLLNCFLMFDSNFFRLTQSKISFRGVVTILMNLNNIWHTMFGPRFVIV